MNLASLLPLLLGIGVNAAGRFPEGPSQQCRDDAGPPWSDDGNTPYYFGFPNAPVLQNGACSPPLQAACETKGPLAAYLDGPIDCGGRGWFCRINDQPGHRMPGMRNGKFPDSNYASCNQKNTEHDRDGHCHGSDDDEVYGWWVRDHWHRNYAGKLKCCCGWGEGLGRDGLGLKGIVNRCDYRKPVKSKDLDKCRDANEEHNVDMHPDCTQEDFENYQEPPNEQCWELTHFGPGPFDDPPGVTQPPFTPGTPPAPTPGTTAPPPPPTPAGAFLLAEDFADADATLEARGWAVVDSGTTQAPSDWTVDPRGFVEQGANIRTRERHAALPKLGTELVYADAAVTAAWPAALSFGAQLLSTDNDVLGLSVARDADGVNQLRVSFEAQKRRGRAAYVRLVRFVDGVPELLATGKWRYRRNRAFGVEIQVGAGECRVFVDGVSVLEASGGVVGGNTGARTVALYSFANRGSFFGNLRVQEIAAPGAPVYAAGDKDDAAAAPKALALPNAASALAFRSNATLEDEDALEEFVEVPGPTSGAAGLAAGVLASVGGVVSATAVLLVV